MTPAPLPAQPVSAGHVARLAMQFWDRASGAAGFPRDPEAVIALALPLSVLDLADLTCGRAAAWAAQNRLPEVPATPDRRLRGCLIAGRGRAVVLVDPADPPQERRLTVAHELGHFLLEVREPRLSVGRVLGPAALDVLDGQRSATFDERLRAILADQPLGPHIHLMTREADGTIGCPRVNEAECAADDFALELLAPFAEVAPHALAVAGRPLQQRWALVTDLLTERFGLPVIAAGGYARFLVEELTGGESIAEIFGIRA